MSPAAVIQLETLMSLLIGVRAAARKNKDFAIGDLIRKRLTELGITLEDRPTRHGMATRLNGR